MLWLLRKLAVARSLLLSLQITEAVGLCAVAVFIVARGLCLVRVLDLKLAHFAMAERHVGPLLRLGARLIVDRQSESLSFWSRPYPTELLPGVVCL